MIKYIILLSVITIVLFSISASEIKEVFATTFSYTEGYRNSPHTALSTGSACSTSITGNLTNGRIKTGSSSVSNDCFRLSVNFAIPSVQDVIVTSGNIKYDIGGASALPKNCDWNALQFNPNATSISEIWNDIGNGTSFLSNSSICAVTSATDTIEPLNSAMLSDLQDNLNNGEGWWGFGMMYTDETRDTSNHITDFTQIELEFTYFLPPDAIDDLSSPSQSYGSVDLLWTQPPLNGGNLSGYQINYTTPWGNPLTIISNNTGTSDTTATVSGLSIDTDYTFGVSAWTEAGNNATHPPMTWLNVTTQGNFTIGSASFNQTNTQVLPITFEEQAINSTATFLNVTYSNTFTLACDFYYQFANNNRTYTGLTGYAVSSTLDETYFILTGHEDEIINIECYDTITGTDADYVMVQSSFPLLDQISNFRNGTYGTMGLFGVFDFITIMVVIFSMIGLNRVNESVGAIFNIILLGTLAWFEIIELPTIIFGALTVVIIFIITSTKKN